MVGMNEVSSLNLEPGNLVGGYTLLSRLGGGAMGSVWRVKDDGGNIYAMKILRDSLSDDDARSQDRQESDTARERLRREAAALRKVDHPGVCQIEDMELDDSLAFIVTELIDGQNLREDVARNGRYVADDLERLAAKLIDAVEAVHRAGIIHRDIKPTNVMISRTGPVLVDFGIAMGAGESHVTRTGLVMGTPGFIAPEIIDGAESDEMTDWWSLAAVLAFAATGRPVFGSKPMMAVLERAAAGHADLSGLPPRTTAALRSALSPDRRKRCTPQELLHAIGLDALEPQLWDMAAQTSVQRTAAGTGNTGETAKQGRVVLPFGKRSSDNPRLLWREADLMTPPPPPAATAGDGHTPRKRVVLAGQTRMVPLADDAQGSAAELLTPPVPPTRQEAAERADEPTTTTAPATATMVLDAVPTTTTVFPGTTVMPNAPTPMPASSATTVLPTSTAGADAETPQAPPERVPDTPPPTPHAYVADKRAAADTRGRLIIILLAIPLCLFAASLPAGGMISAMLLLWLFTTTGLSAEAQFKREGKRGGQRKGTDAALQIGSLPWHMVKGLAFSVVPSLLMLALSTALAAFLGAATALQTVQTGGTVLGVAVRIPLIAGDALSASGLVLMLCMAAGWFIGTLGPYSRYARIGAGVIRDGDASDDEDDGYDDESASERWTRLSRRLGQRGWTLLIVWAVLVLAGVAILLTGDPVDWSPIVLAF